MPYIDNRNALDELIKNVVERLGKEIKDKKQIGEKYFYLFNDIVERILGKTGKDELLDKLVESIKNAEELGWIGRLNYVITRIIVLTPKKLVEKGILEKEMKYWLYVMTIESLIKISDKYKNYGYVKEAWGVCGVFEDIKDEYKRRVNSAYEVFAMKKNGDCYDTPYKTEYLTIYTNDKKPVGIQEIYIKKEEQK